jgi:hypothetical protein
MGSQPGFMLGGMQDTTYDDGSTAKGTMPSDYALTNSIQQGQALSQAQQQYGLMQAQDMANGVGPMTSTATLQDQANRSMANQTAMGNSGAGGSGMGLARRQAAMANAQTQQQLGAQADTARAQQQLDAMGLQGQIAAQSRTQDLGMAQNQMSLLQQQEQQNQQLYAVNQGVSEANTQQAMQGAQAGAALAGGLLMAAAAADMPMASGLELKEPSGPSHWVLREEPDFILAHNARTGEMRKIATTPLSRKERRQAQAPHGAGPLQRFADMPVGPSPEDGPPPGATVEEGPLGNMGDKTVVYDGTAAPPPAPKFNTDDQFINDTPSSDLGASYLAQAQAGSQAEQQQALLAANSVASGRGPSAAASKLRAEADQAMSAQDAAASSGSGTMGGNLARRNAMMTNQQAMAQMGAGAAKEAGKEQTAGLSSQAQIAGQARGQDLGLSQDQASWLQQQQEIAVQNYALSKGKSEANFQTGMQGAQMGAGAISGGLAAMGNGGGNSGTDTSSDERVKTDSQPQRSGLSLARDADLKEPGGDAHWVLREEPNFILAHNARTGEVRKLATQPLTAAEKKQAKAPHGAGPLDRFADADVGGGDNSTVDIPGQDKLGWGDQSMTPSTTPTATSAATPTPGAAATSTSKPNGVASGGPSWMRTVGAGLMSAGGKDPSALLNRGKKPGDKSPTVKPLTGAKTDTPVADKLSAASASDTSNDIPGQDKLSFGSDLNAATDAPGPSDEQVMAAINAPPPVGTPTTGGLAATSSDIRMKKDRRPQRFSDIDHVRPHHNELGDSLSWQSLEAATTPELRLPEQRIESVSPAIQMPEQRIVAPRPATLQMPQQVVHDESPTLNIAPQTIVGAAPEAPKAEAKRSFAGMSAHDIWRMRNGLQPEGHAAKQATPAEAATPDLDRELDAIKADKPYQDAHAAEDQRIAELLRHKTATPPTMAQETYGRYWDNPDTRTINRKAYDETPASDVDRRRFLAGELATEAPYVAPETKSARRDRLGEFDWSGSDAGHDWAQPSALAAADDYGLAYGEGPMSAEPPVRRRREPIDYTRMTDAELRRRGGVGGLAMADR